MDIADALEVIREESEDDDDDSDITDMYIRYTSEPCRVPACTRGKIDCMADENSSYHSNSNQNVFTDKNTNTTDILRRRSGSRSSSVSTVKKMKVIEEPTYRMEPKPDEYFIWYKVRNALNKMITPFFENFKYHSPAAGNFCKMVCNKAMATIRKKHEWPRYRYVCHVTLFQLNEQGVIVGDRSLTYSGVDNCAVCLFKNKEVVLIVTFHGMYYE